MPLLTNNGFSTNFILLKQLQTNLKQKHQTMLHLLFLSFFMLSILTATNMNAASTSPALTDPTIVLIDTERDLALDGIISQYGTRITMIQLETLFMSISLCLAKAANSYLPLCTRRSEHNKAHQLLLDLDCCKELITLEEFINFTMLIEELRATKQALEQLVSLNPSLLDPLHRG